MFCYNFQFSTKISTKYKSPPKKNLEMATTRERIDNFSHTLDAYLIDFSNDPETEPDTVTIDVLTKLKIALFNYTKTTNKLTTLENSEGKDTRRLSLSCASVISQLVDDDIIEYIATCWGKDGRPTSVINHKMKVSSLTDEILKLTKDMEVVVRKYKWARSKISDTQ